MHAKTLSLRRASCALRARPWLRSAALAAAAAGLLSACGGGGGADADAEAEAQNETLSSAVAEAPTESAQRKGGTKPPHGVPAVRETNTLEGLTRDVRIEFHEGTNLAAAPSPDGKQIAFTAQGALWLMPVGGGKARRITPWTIEPTAPVWSPDGKTIAFQNYTREGNYHLWAVAPDGSRLRELTTGFFDDREPEWLPDGSGLVFASDRGNDGQYKLWQFTLASGVYKPLTSGPGAESNPAVSRDGKQLAFVDTARVFTVPLEGGTPTLVGPGLAPAWAPDGTLVYQRSTTVLVAGDKDIVSGEDLFPFPVRWLPDGRFLHTANGKIRIRDLAGTSVKDVPFSATLTVRRPVYTKRKDQHFGDFGPRQVKGISAPALSPDGRSIAFVALNDVWVMKIGEAPVRLTNDADRDGNVQWTPDGSAVYFSTERGNGGALAVDQVSVATKARKRLAAIAGKSMVSPKMSPAGDRIAYTALSGQLEVWDMASRSSQLVMPQVSTQLSTPQWTPDASRILLVDNQRVNNRFREGYNQLRVIDVARRTDSFHPVAEAPRQIADREEGAAVLSPDGTKLAFVMDAVLHVMPLNRDGSPAGAAKAITTEVADLPSWAGDSKTLLYKSADALRLVRADGSGRETVPVDLQWKQAAGEGLTIVHAGALWDGLGATLKHDVDIVIVKNRIAAIRPHQAVSRKLPGVRFIDASQLTVMPGLWDPHIHPLTLYQGGQYGQIAALMLSYGITSTLSVAGPLHQSIEMREALEAGNLVGPRLFTSPPLWEGNRQFYSFARTLRTPEVADLEIAKARTLGVDFMKSYVRAPIPIMVKIAQAGVDAGIPTGTHMLAPGSATGLGGTTHLSATQRMGYGWAKSPNLLTYQDAYTLHAASGFNVIDTLFSSVGPMVGLDPSLIGDDRFTLLVPPNFVAGLQAQAGTPPTPEALAGVKRDAVQSGKVQTAGGLVALGTDSPLVAPGIALHTNLRAGGLAYSNLQALQNVTINAARMALVERELGSVEPGKLADLTMVRGNPLADLKAAADVELVMKNGRAYSLPQILAPFRTPTALLERRKALAAYRKLCGGKAVEAACGSTAHAH